jgi:hypothetical protein
MIWCYSGNAEKQEYNMGGYEGHSINMTVLVGDKWCISMDQALPVCVLVVGMNSPPGNNY